MTRSSQPVREHIFDFDDDFERTLKRKRNQQESNPPNLEPELEEEEVEEATAQELGEAQVMAADNRKSRSSQLRDWTMLCPYAFNIPRQLKARLKSSS
ncbi:hypothetical protein EV1_033520 [Malus domestica]